MVELAVLVLGLFIKEYMYVYVVKGWTGLL